MDLFMDFAGGSDETWGWEISHCTSHLHVSFSLSTSVSCSSSLPGVTVQGEGGMRDISGGASSSALLPRLPVELLRLRLLAGLSSRLSSWLINESRREMLSSSSSDVSLPIARLFGGSLLEGDISGRVGRYGRGSWSWYLLSIWLLWKGTDHVLCTIW